jgi:hypothetical protein
MLVINCEQGSPEWHQARAGVITASMFSEVRKRLASGKNKGDFSQKAKEYAFRLAVERISGELLSEDKFDTWEMKRGRELEPFARLNHEAAKGILVEQTGIVLTEDRKFGASVDGLIDDDGCSEYKCFISPSSLMPILLEADTSDIDDQIQGGLWITGRQYCDFVLYCPALKNIGRDTTIITRKRDEEYIATMEKELLEFDRFVEQTIKTLKGEVHELAKNNRAA